MIWFATGWIDGCQLTFDVRPRSASAGNTVRKLDSVALSTVTLAAIEVAVDGMMQSPLVPDTDSVAVSSGPIGVVLLPTSEAGRVSTKRHGTIDTNDDADELTAKTC